MKFKVVSGIHRVSRKGPPHRKGDIVESDSPLSLIFPNKFILIEGVILEDPKKEDKEDSSTKLKYRDKGENVAINTEWVPGFEGRFYFSGKSDSETFFIVDSNTEKRVSPKKVRKNFAVTLIKRYLTKMSEPAEK